MGFKTQLTDTKLPSSDVIVDKMSERFLLRSNFGLHTDVSGVIVPEVIN